MRFSLLLVVLLFLSACNAPAIVNDVIPYVPSDGQLSQCSSDSDCIPIPSQCHPTRCINKDFDSAFERPDACTEIFMAEAAYTSQDCACENALCINKNAQPTELPLGATKCTIRSDACTLEFQPVCGFFKESVQCIKAPCAIDAGNPCQACADENVAYWVEGECEA